MNHQYCIIMSGGIGSRFWPLSRHSHPKQFVDFFGTGRTLLQSTYDRFARFIPKDHIYIVTHESYKAKTMEQLPELDPKQILSEPKRRNTAPCIAYASFYIKQRDPEACIAVTASDHVVLNEEQFEHDLSAALRFVSQENYLITLGIKPTRAETGYGYIQMSDVTHGDFIKVKTFTEKPNAEMAQVFLDSGEFLWNSGMFVWNVATITAAFEKYMPEMAKLFDGKPGVYNTDKEKEFIEKVYTYCTAISIDYAIMEKADNVLVYPSGFGWADLGTWGSYYEISPKDSHENATPLHTRASFYDAKRNIVSLDNPQKIAVIQGIDDCIIAQKDNVLLVCKRSEEQRIKSFILDTGLSFGEEYT